jgi:hypothetical protein
MEQREHPRPTELIRQLHAELIEQNSISIVTELINTLPGNSSVNTTQQATIDETVFTVSSASCQVLVTD